MLRLVNDADAENTIPAHAYPHQCMKARGREAPRHAYRQKGHSPVGKHVALWSTCLVFLPSCYSSHERRRICCSPTRYASLDTKTPAPSTPLRPPSSTKSAAVAILEGAARCCLLAMRHATCYMPVPTRRDFARTCAVYVRSCLRAKSHCEG